MRGMCLVAMVALVGCAAPPAPVQSERAAPADFTLDVIVLRGPAAPAPDAPHRRAAHYVLFPDGSLHRTDPSPRPTGTDLEPEAPRADELPERVRVLSTAEMDDVWSLACDLGLAGSSAEGVLRESAGNLAHLAPPHDGVLCAIAITARGASVLTVASEPGPSVDAEGARALVARLAHLSWSDEPSAEGRRFAPRRYDFGPDPYARYRQQ